MSRYKFNFKLGYTTIITFIESLLLSEQIVLYVTLDVVLNKETDVDLSKKIGPNFLGKVTL